MPYFCYVYSLCIIYIQIFCHNAYSVHNVYFIFFINKRSERRKHCMLVVLVRWSQIFLPSRRPLPGCTGWPKFNQLEMVTTFTYKPILVRINARNFELSW